MMGTAQPLAGLRTMRRLLALAVLAALLTAGCGVYTFNPKGKSSLGSIAIEPFENQTGQYGLTDQLTQLIIDAFIADGNINVLPPADAEAILQGVLTRYERVPQTFDENDQVQQYKVVMGFQLSLRNPGDDTEIWNERMNQEGVYDAINETEEDGQQRASELLVEAIINKTTKAW